MTQCSQLTFSVHQDERENDDLRGETTCRCVKISGRGLKLMEKCGKTIQHDLEVLTKHKERDSGPM